MSWRDQYFEAVGHIMQDIGLDQPKKNSPSDSVVYRDEIFVTDNGDILTAIDVKRLKAIVAKASFPNACEIADELLKLYQVRDVFTTLQTMKFKNIVDDFLSIYKLDQNLHTDPFEASPRELEHVNLAYQSLRASLVSLREEYFDLRRLETERQTNYLKSLQKSNELDM